jgi:hypothetical protein
MSSGSSDTATSIISALSWFAVGVMTFLIVWTHPMHWVWALLIGLPLGFVAVGYGIECLAGEMTVRKWAIGQLVFTVLAVALLLAGIFAMKHSFFPRWGLFTAGGIFSLSALLSALAAKDVL